MQAFGWSYLPILLAIGVGLSQIYLARSHDLTPSKAGGFGLFSTVDKLENRNLRAYLITEQQEIPFAIPQYVPATEALRKPIYRAASLPTERHLRTILEDLLTKPYQVLIKGIRIEVWKLAFDSAKLRASRIKVRELTVDRSGHVTN
jgi:hypothetical protein